MKKTKTMREIAQDLGLSLTTVSICLSGKEKKYKIKAETAGRVKKYVEKIGYIPNAAARNLVKQNNAPGKVALLLCQASGSEKSMTALRLAMKTLELSDRDYHFQDCFPHTFTSAIRSMKGEGVRDIILFGPFHNGRKEWEELRNDFKAISALLRGINMYIIDDCFVGQPLLENQVYRMGVDRKQTYFDLFDRIKAHSDGWLACDHGCLQIHEFSSYCTTHYSSFDPAQFFSQDETIEDSFDRGKALTKTILALIERLPVRFLFLHDDRVATGLVDGLLNCGVKIPDDISIIGFDNIDACPYFKIPLTSISIPVEKHVQMALSKILNGENIPKVTKSSFEIIWRESCKQF